MTRSRSLSFVPIAMLLVPLAIAAGGGEPGAPGSRTFQPKNLDVTTTAAVLREFTGFEGIVADPEAGTITVGGEAAPIDIVDTAIKVFDTEQREGKPPLEMRVFHLDHLSARAATTLLRSKMQVTAVVLHPERARVALRDSTARLDEAGRLLAEADAAVTD